LFLRIELPLSSPCNTRVMCRPCRPLLGALSASFVLATPDFRIRGTQQAHGGPEADALAFIQTQLKPQINSSHVFLMPSAIALEEVGVSYDSYPTREPASELPLQNLHSEEEEEVAVVDSALKLRGRIFQILPVLIILGLGASKLQHLFTLRQSLTFSKLVEVALALVLYMVSGPAVILVNKCMIREHKFHFPIVLASLGNLLLMFVTRGMVATGMYKLETPSLEWRRYWRVVIPVNFLNFAAQVLGMWAYLFISVPEIQILKSITIVLVLIVAYFLVNEPVSWKLIAAVLIIAGGTCVSAIFETEEGNTSGGAVGTVILGVALCLLASMCEAGKTVTCQVLMDSLSVFDGLYWSSPLFALLACICVAAVEVHRLVHFSFSFGLVGLLVLNAVLTGLVVLSSFWLIKLAGALTLKVLMQARTIGLILCSVLFFHENCTSQQYFGYSITLIGMAAFDHAKRTQAKAK